jgi:hypothetical protein
MVWDTHIESVVVGYRVDSREFITSSVTRIDFCFRGSQTIRTIDLVDIEQRESHRLKRDVVRTEELQAIGKGWQSVVYNETTDRLFIRNLSNRLWQSHDISTGKSLDLLFGNFTGGLAIEDQLALCGDFQIKIFDPAKNDFRCTIPIVHKLGSVKSTIAQFEKSIRITAMMSLSENGTTLAINEPPVNSRRLTLWDVDLEKRTKVIREFDNQHSIRDMAFVRKNQISLIELNRPNYRSVLSLINIETGDVSILKVGEHYQFLAQGGHGELIFAATDQFIDVYDPIARELQCRIPFENAVSIKVTPNDQLLAIADETGRIEFLSVDTGLPVWSISPNRPSIYHSIPIAILTLLLLVVEVVILGRRWKG